MTHAIVLSFYNAALTVLERRIGHVPDRLSAVGFVLIAIAIAAFAYHTIEAPAQQWLRAFGRRRHVRGAQEVESVAS